MGEITADPKTWPTPNYTDPDTIVPEILGVTIATLIVMITFITARMYGRLTRKVRSGWDDWLMCIAALVCVALCTVTSFQTKYGSGYHVWDIKPEWVLPYRALGITDVMLFSVTVGFTKVSICVTYLRLFPTRLDKIFSWSLIAFEISYVITTVFASLLACRPLEASWDPAVIGDCIDVRAYLVSIGIINSISDFLVYLWPMRVFWGLQLPKAQKIGLIVMFGVGIVVCIVGLVRVWFFSTHFVDFDAFYISGYSNILAALEANIGIMCGCCSGMKPFLHRILPRWISSYGDSTSGGVRYTGGAYGSRSAANRSGRHGSHHLASGQSFPFQVLSGAAHSEDVGLKNDQTGITVANVTSHDSASERTNIGDSHSQGSSGAPPVPVDQIGVKYEIRMTSTPAEGERKK